jgi:adenosylcobinamide-GDP ribazoletransferase
MNLIYSCMIAISMYSKIPMPQIEWKEERMKHVMCFFPVVGLIEGALLGLWLFFALKIADLSFAMAALWGTALPVLVTGGIHMDGFLDTMDAIHSYGDREKKLEILKDPHVGAFAVISCLVYGLLYAGIMWEYAITAAGEGNGFVFLLPIWLFAMERIFSGLSVLCFPKAKKDGLAASFARAAEKKQDQTALACWLLCLLAASFLLGKRGAGAVWLAALVQLLFFFFYRKMAGKEFGGVTGDLAGWFLQCCELTSLTAVVYYLKMGVLL